MQYTVDTDSRGSEKGSDNTSKRVQASRRQEEGQEGNNHENGEDSGCGKLKTAHGKMIGSRAGQDKRQKEKA